MYPFGLTITPEPRPCSVCLPCLCGARPPKNCFNASSENESAACPRDTVCVVNTVTTLGATFSTTGAKVVTIPSRLWLGCCAVTEDRLVPRYKAGSARRLHTLRVFLSITGPLQKRIGRTVAVGSFCLLSCWESQVYAPFATDR